MKSKFRITALDQQGDPVVDKETSEDWAISEVQCEFDKLKMLMYTGQVKHIIIEGVE